jgi:hypothetical protein
LNRSREVRDVGDEPEGDYEWMVAIMLEGCEAKAKYASGKADWKSTIEQQIAEHKAYVGSKWFREPRKEQQISYFAACSRDLVPFIDRVAPKNYK